MRPVSPATDAATLRRRYLLLTATRWLPTGALVPLITVVPLERGLSLVDVGVMTAAGGCVVLLLELPSGGLADVWGRRPVLLAATACSLAAAAWLTMAGSLTTFVLAWCLEGVARALDSGPLDSWYVDAATSADPAADIEGGLARKGVVLSGAMGAGALATGGLALLPQPDWLPALGLPILVAVILRAVDGLALVALLDEVATAARPSVAVSRPWAVPSGLVRGTVRAVGDCLGLLRASTALAALAATELLWGAGMAGVEIFSAPRLVELLGDARRGVLAFAVAAAIGWIASGLGAGAAPWLARRTRSWVAAAVITRLTQGVSVLLAGVVAGPAGLLTGYVGFYLVHGAANVAHYGLVHRNVGAAHRTTMISVNALASRLGGIASMPLLGVLASTVGLAPVFTACAVVLAAGAPLYLLARSGRSRSRVWRTSGHRRLDAGLDAPGEAG